MKSKERELLWLALVGEVPGETHPRSRRSAARSQTEHLIMLKNKTPTARPDPWPHTDNICCMSDMTPSKGGRHGCAAETNAGRACKRAAMDAPDPDGARRCTAHSTDPARVAARRRNGDSLRAHNGSAPNGAAPFDPVAAFDLGQASGCTAALTDILRRLGADGMDASTARAAAEVIKTALTHHTGRLAAEARAKAAAAAAQAPTNRTVFSFELAKP